MMDDIDRSFSWWSAALKGMRGPIDANDPKSGFYRAKSRDKTLSAVAIWYDSNSGNLRYQENGRDIDELRARERWPYVSKTPISEETFWAFRDTGVWPDIDGAAQSGTPPENAPDESDPTLTLTAKIAAAKANIAQYLKIDSDELATKARSLQSALLGFKGEAVKNHKAEKQPLTDAGRLVDAKWFPLRDTADAGAIELRTALEDWELAKRKAAQAAEERGVPSNMPAPSSKVVGGSGRAATPKPWNEVVSIDIDAVFKQFRDEPRLREDLMMFAQEAINAGIAVPGAKTEERIRLR